MRTPGAVLIVDDQSVGEVALLAPRYSYLKAPLKLTELTVPPVPLSTSRQNAPTPETSQPGLPVGHAASVHVPSAPHVRRAVLAALQSVAPGSQSPALSVQLATPSPSTVHSSVAPQ